MSAARAAQFIHVGRLPRRSEPGQSGQGQQPGRDLKEKEQPEARLPRRILRGQGHTGDACVMQRAPEDQAAEVAALHHGLDRGEQQCKRARQKRQE